MTALDIPAFVTKPKSLTDMTQTVADLLKQADDSNLPAPAHVTLYQGGQEARLGFPGERASFHTLADWAVRFGGTVTGEPYTRDDGELSVHCEARFHYQGVTVAAYAYIPADQLGIT
jgi:hypothetical protein